MPTYTKETLAIRAIEAIDKATLAKLQIGLIKANSAAHMPQDYFESRIGLYMDAEGIEKLTFEIEAEANAFCRRLFIELKTDVFRKNEDGGIESGREAIAYYSVKSKKSTQNWMADENNRAILSASTTYTREDILDALVELHSELMPVGLQQLLQKERKGTREFYEKRLNSFLERASTLAIDNLKMFAAAFIRTTYSGGTVINSKLYQDRLDDDELNVRNRILQAAKLPTTAASKEELLDKLVQLHEATMSKKLRDGLPKKYKDDIRSFYETRLNIFIEENGNNLPQVTDLDGFAAAFIHSTALNGKIHTSGEYRTWLQTENNKDQLLEAVGPELKRQSLPKEDTRHAVTGEATSPPPEAPSSDISKVKPKKPWPITRFFNFIASLFSKKTPPVPTKTAPTLGETAPAEATPSPAKTATASAPAVVGNKAEKNTASGRDGILVPTADENERVVYKNTIGWTLPTRTNSQQQVIADRETKQGDASGREERVVYQTLEMHRDNPPAGATGAVSEGMARANGKDAAETLESNPGASSTHTGPDTTA